VVGGVLDFARERVMVAVERALGWAPSAITQAPVRVARSITASGSKRSA